jgi:hypothetical protein
LGSGFAIANARFDLPQQRQDPLGLVPLDRHDHLPPWYILQSTWYRNCRAVRGLPSLAEHYLEHYWSSIKDVIVIEAGNSN